MASNVGGLYVDLGLNSRGFQSGLRTAQGELQKFGAKAEAQSSRLGQAFAGLGKGMTLALGAAGIGLGLSEAVTQMRRVVSEVAELSAQAKMAGVGVEVFQELAYAAQQAHVSTDALTDGMKELQLRADEFAATGKGSAAEAFQRIGFTAEELKGKLQDPVALFEEIIRRIYDLDKAAQIRVADELFGGTAGEQFVRFLALGQNSVARLRKEAQDTGKVISKDLVDGAEEVDKRFKAMALTVETQLKKAVLGLIDALRGFASAVADSLKVVADAPAAALAKTQQEVNGIRAAMDEARKTHNMAVVGDLERRLADAEKRAAALSEVTREASRGTALSELGGSGVRQNVPLPPTRPAGLAGSGVDVAALEKAKAAAEALATAYQNMITSARQRLAEARTELATMGMATEEAAAYRFEQEMLNEAIRSNIPLTAAQQAEIKGLAQQYAQVEGQIEKARGAQERMNELRSATAGFLTDLRTGLKEGKSLADSFADAVGNLTEKMIEMLQNELLMQLFKGMSGFSAGGSVGRGGGSIGLYASGGAIRGPGTGTSDSVPAMLSNGEFVVRASEAKKHGALLEAINSGRLHLPRFATGGPVNMPRISSGGGDTGSLSVQVVNQTGTPASGRAEVTRGVNGDAVVRVVLDAVKRDYASGGFDQAQMARFGGKPRPVRRG